MRTQSSLYRTREGQDEQMQAAGCELGLESPLRWYSSGTVDSAHNHWLNGRQALPS